MEKNSEMDVNRWVEERLATLSPDGEWQPNATRGLARLREQRGAGSGRGRRWAWAAAAATAACLCLMALPAPRALAQRCLNCSAALWQSLSASGPVRAGVKPEKDRTMAPDFTLNDVSDKPVKLSDFKGKVVVLNFWATWCRPCIEELPSLQRFHDRFAAQNVVVLAVSEDEDAKAYQQFLKKEGVRFPTVRDPEGKVSQSYGTFKLPETYFIDRQGRVVRKIIGAANWMDPELILFMEQLLKMDQLLKG
jgi:cytochrome c biogenesis protein CcmG/thiol:disulfide interchange protein DsbE